MLRTRTRIRDNWKFWLGDAPDAAAPGYNDEQWRTLNVPHDFSIEGEFNEQHPCGTNGAFLPGGVGWYRKTLDIPDAYRGQKLLLEFDGAQANAEVWINGVSLGKRPNGYISFAYEITPHVRYGEPNVIAVKVDTSQQPHSRWYTGSGINRDVWLTVTSPVHVAQWGSFVTTPEVSPERAVVSIETRVCNDTPQEQQLDIITRIRNAEGDVAADVTTSATIPAQSEKTISQSCELRNPTLWEPDSPNLYIAETIVETHGGASLRDEYHTPFGIRTFEFTSDQGFFLNGKSVKLKGLNLHEDLGPLGAAYNEAATIRRLKQLKELGCNALRTAHNPFPPGFFDLCDRLGFLVIAEFFDEWRQGKRDFSYYRHFDDWWERDLADQVLRDRNHPCIILWSLGNEIPDKGEQACVQTCAMLRDAVHALDPTRPTTAGVDEAQKGNRSGFSDVPDVLGYNHGGDSFFHVDDSHRAYPHHKLYTSEGPHTFATRGVYRTTTYYRDKTQNPEKFAREIHVDIPDLAPEEVFPEFHPAYASSYDNATVRISCADSWQQVAARDFVAGEFRWTGVDYWGESHGWPAKFGSFGIIDLCGFPKDPYYLYQSFWSSKTMLHLLPHWTWPGKEGLTIPVWAYTNCDEVELFLNGKSLGKRTKTEQDGYLAWDVAYTPGILLAVGAIASEEVLREKVHTAGPGAALRLDADRAEIVADGRDVSHLTVNILDDAGHVVPTAHHLVRFTVQGPGRIVGVGNGDPLSDEATVATQRSTFHGLCLAIVQSTTQAGEILVTAEAAGLTPAFVLITTTNRV